MTTAFVLAGSLDKWHESNDGLNIHQHIDAIIWHSQRIAQLETEIIFYDDPLGRDLRKGKWFKRKATPSQLALAEQQKTTRDAIRFHEVSVRLHRIGATKSGLYRGRKRCAFGLLESALEKLEEQQRRRDQ